MEMEERRLVQFAMLTGKQPPPTLPQAPIPAPTKKEPAKLTRKHTMSSRGRGKRQKMVSMSAILNEEGVSVDRGEDVATS